MADEITFRVCQEMPASLTPIISGRSLVDLVREFEVTRNYEPPGGYGGLVPSFFNFGDLQTYLLGVHNHQWSRPGTTWLLGCDCGEVGCWPLEAKVESRPAEVVWSDFSQPFRPERDYEGFGPFTFAREQYESAVGVAVDLPGVRSGEG